jgi:hypothetical protein
MKFISCFVFSIVITFCNRNTSNKTECFISLQRGSSVYETVGDIPVPAGYKRVAEEKNSLGEWLRKVHLKRDPGIYLFNGKLRDDQSTHFAVLDMPVGDKDLQQCADAIMRLKAEYFFNHDYIDSIRFKATDGTDLCFAKWMKGERYRLKGARLAAYNSGFFGANKRQQLEQFLEVVFSYCGTISLDKETKPVNDLNNLSAGDLFIKAGSPGHAMIVVDVAINDRGEKIFMLAQGLMPAQSIHIVKNLLNETLSPWYRVTGDLKMITPEWIFYRNQLRRW